MSEFKRCTKCKIQKPLNQFLEGFTTPDLRNSWCIQCMNQKYGGDWFKTYRGVKWSKENE